jgi:hypothetical protein
LTGNWLKDWTGKITGCDLAIGLRPENDRIRDALRNGIDSGFTAAGTRLAGVFWFQGCGTAGGRSSSAGPRDQIGFGGFGGHPRFPT